MKLSEVTLNDPTHWTRPYIYTIGRAYTSERKWFINHFPNDETAAANCPEGYNWDRYTSTSQIGIC